MKNTKLILFLLLFSSFCLGTYELVDKFILAGELIPVPLTNNSNQVLTALPIVAVDLNGKIVDLKDFRRQVVIVNFWASWCPPCVEEFPSLLRLVDRFEGQVVLLAISNDSQPDHARQFLRKFNLESKFLNVIWDQGQKIMDSYLVNKLPESFIFRRDGVFVRRISGFQNWDDPKVIKLVADIVSN